MDVLTALNKLYDRFGREYRPGEVVFSEGEAGGDMFFVLSGSFEVVKDVPAKDSARREQVVLAKLSTGDFFGEMELLLDEPRSAGVRAVEGSRVVRISPGNFDTIVKIQPQIAIQMLRTLAQRLGATSSRVAKQ